MTRYIDAGEIGIGKCNPDVFKDKEYARGWNDAVELIEKTPTADVVEVIRCKDCIYRWFNGVNLHTCVRDTANGEPIVNLEDFCSYGKKVE